MCARLRGEGRHSHKEKRSKRVCGVIKSNRQAMRPLGKKKSNGQMRTEEKHSFFEKNKKTKKLYLDGGGGLMAKA